MPPREDLTPRQLRASAIVSASEYSKRSFLPIEPKCFSSTGGSRHFARVLSQNICAFTLPFFSELKIAIPPVRWPWFRHPTRPELLVARTNALVYNNWHRAERTPSNAD